MIGRFHAALLCALLMPLMATFLTWKVTNNFINEKNEAAFLRVIAESEANFQAHINAFQRAFIAGGAFFAGSTYVSQEDWRKYVDGLDLEKSYKGLLGLGYIKDIGNQTYENYIQEMRHNGAANFSIHPDKRFSDNFIITYIEPSGENSIAIGYNIATEQNRREAAILSRDTGRTVITNPIHLLQVKDNRANFLIMYPMYSQKLVDASPQQRRKSFTGWIYAPVIATDIFGDLATSEIPFFDMRVYAGTDDNGALIFDSHKINNINHQSLYTVRKNMNVFQKDWHFEWKSTQEFEDSVHSNESTLILIGGGVLTFFMVSFLMLFSKRSEAIQELVDRKTEEIRLHKEELQLIFDHVPVRIWYKDELSNILRLNDRAAKAMGGNVTDFIGKNMADFFPEKASESRNDDLEVLNSGQSKIGIIEEFTPMHCKSGWAETSKIPFLDTLAGRNRLLVVSQDITERKIAEETLRKSEELNELVIRGLSAGVWDWDIENKKIYLSEKLRDVLGWHKRGMAISFEEFVDSLHEDDREKCAEFLNSHLTKKSPFDMECKILNGAGEYVWVHICGQASWNCEGKSRRMVGSLTDISERKQAEEELLRSNLELERFAYIASHDLQEPVRMIRNFSKLLTDEYESILSAEALEYLMFINRGAKNIQDMVEDLLEYSLAGQNNSVVEMVELDTVIRNVLEVLRSTIDESKAQVTYDLLPVVAGNTVNFSRLFQNLIGNGLKYRRAGIAPEIHIMAEDLGDTWLFSISDNGIGIKEEYLEKIFIIFKRLHNKSEYQGTGIGLAICKKIIDGMGGRIWAESQYGEGTDFHFTIPKDLSDKFVEGDL